jgi:Protein of unknown function
MSDSDDTDRDRPLTPEEEAKARRLTDADLQRIDVCLLSYTSHQWRKVAYVIGRTMLDLHREFPLMPDGFYSSRIKHLVDSGAIEAAGNLNSMRYSEVRLPGPRPADSQ